MKDPVSAGGAAAIRYAFATVPPFVALPIGLVMPLGIRSGHVQGGVTAAFTCALIVPFLIEAVRSGSVFPASGQLRRLCLAVLTAIYLASPPLAGVAVLLGVGAVTGCAGACSPFGYAMAVVGLVFAVLALLAAMGLLVFLRSPLWRQHRAASAQRTDAKLFP